MALNQTADVVVVSARQVRTSDVYDACRRMLDDMGHVEAVLSVQMAGRRWAVLRAQERGDVATRHQLAAAMLAAAGQFGQVAQ